MYTPTKEQLEELGFESQGIHGYFSGDYEVFEGHNIRYIEGHPEYQFYLQGIPFYPQSIDDIKNLIKILTPNN